MFRDKRHLKVEGTLEDGTSKVFYLDVDPNRTDKEIVEKVLTHLKSNPPIEIYISDLVIKGTGCFAADPTTRKKIKGDQEEKHEHVWEVYSTAVGDGGVIMVECSCGVTGYIDDYTKEEWAAAFHAPSNPYKWTDNKRVIIE